MQNLTFPQLQLSAAALLEFSLTKLFPGIQPLSFKSIDTGFYCDFISESLLHPKVLPLIEERMRADIKSAIPINSRQMLHSNAIAFFEHLELPLKVDQLENLETNTQLVDIIQIDEFYDVCPLPHISNTQQIGAFKLNYLEVISKDDLKGHCIRIQGTASFNKQSLKQFLKKVEISKKNDPILLAQQLKLLHLSEDNSPGFIWTQKGKILLNLLREWWTNEHTEQGFHFITTPRLISQSTLKKAGYYPHSTLAETLNPPLELSDVEFHLVHTQTLSHLLLYYEMYKVKIPQPIKFAECGTLFSLDINKSKETSLWKGYEYTGDEAHIFIHFNQVEAEIISSLLFLQKIAKILCLNCHCYLAGVQPSSLGKANSLQNQWKGIFKYLVNALDNCQVKYTELPKQEHQAYFGPRIEFRLVDMLEREWSALTLEVNLVWPYLFNSSRDGAEVPILLKRTMFGSFERVIATLLQQNFGKLPLWLAPEQVRIIPIKQDQASYAAEICESLKAQGFRAVIDIHRTKKLEERIHLFQQEKVPYAILIGDREEQGSMLTIRSYSESGSFKMLLSSFLERLHLETER